MVDDFVLSIHDYPGGVQRIMTALITTSIMALAVVVRAEQPAEVVDYQRDIRPIFQQHCTKCHGGVRREAGLSFLSESGLASSESGKPVIIAGKPDESELVRRVTAPDPDIRMPAGQPPLTTPEVQKLRRWIEAGAAWPNHWSFVPLTAPVLPEVRHGGWLRNAIDSFVLARLETSGLAVSLEAHRNTLIRRLSLDLIGLPPTPDEADAFAADTSPDAYQRLVDRLLASPHFGERWGRHWLDQARYADSDGYELDKPRPDAYRWRDWVIDAVNRDLPFDQFTVQQFAGDLLPDATPLQRLATAYHRQTLTNNEGGVDKEEYRFKAVLDRASNTGTVWLGLTLTCTQCHNHPYDPFTQREFYELAAIFNNADEAEIELLQSTSPDAKPRKLPILAQRPMPRSTLLLKRGEFLQPGDEVQPGLLQRLHAWEPTSTDRPVDRLMLARWLVNRDNPLTPRVTVNQIWLRLFGHGLVRTPEDFGARGERPAHAELLDWLAREFLLRSWSRKELIRQIVTSASYRQSSNHRSELDSVDPHNLLLARQNRLRVEAEIVRDLHLAAGGLLTNRIGGPSVFPPLGAEFVKITFRSELPWKTSTGEDRYRRGMYTFFKRSVPYPDLMLFDCPDASTAAVERVVSNTPLQALTTLNGATYVEAARGLARRMFLHSRLDHGAQIEYAFRVCVARQPSPSESARLVELLHDCRAWYEAHPDDARQMLGDWQDDNLEIPDAAALVATANVLMNIDEFITRD